MFMGVPFVVDEVVRDRIPWRRATVPPGESGGTADLPEKQS
jgi:hypothetical protein